MQHVSDLIKSHHPGLYIYIYIYIYIYVCVCVCVCVCTRALINIELSTAMCAVMSENRIIKIR